MANTSEIGYDLSFDINEFGQPRLQSPIELIKDVLMFILFSKPGQYPSMPMIGLDIHTMLYSFYDSIDIANLKSQIIQQCSILGAYLDSGSISIQKMKYRNQPSMMIRITGSETYPEGYLRDNVGTGDNYLIGISFDELQKMVYNVSRGSM